MANVYSAQNVTSYFIYELNETYQFINAIAVQQLLYQVDQLWMSSFGHSIFSEQTHCLQTFGYYIKEVHEAYAEHGNKHIPLPAREWFLKYGEFQLVYRTYSVPAFTEEEQKIVNEIINRYVTTTFDSVNIAV